MTTIILVIIGVLIAAAAALMLLFYGGDSYRYAEVRAEAGRLVNEGAQITYAFDFYQQQEGSIPGNGSDGTAALNDLVSRDYLANVPKGFGGLDGDWRIDFTEGMIRSRLGPTSIERNNEVCREARRQLGMTGDTIYQCDGSDHPGGKLPSREPCCIEP